MAKKPKKAKVFNFKSWMISALRRLSRRYPPIYQALNAAKSEHYVPSKHGKMLRRVMFKCAQCAGVFSRKEVNVDHVESVVSTTEGFPLLADGLPDWNTYIARLLPESTAALQVLCSGCHDAKSAKENEERRAHKAAAKERNS